MVSFSELPFSPTGDPLGANIASDALYGPEQPLDMPVGYAILENLPNATTMVGWNAWRGSNTIMKAKGANPSSGKSVRNTLSPFRFGKMKSYDNIGGTNKAYTPFNVLSDVGNRVADRSVKKNPASIMGQDDLVPGEGQTHFTGGTYTRLSTAARLDSANLTSKKGKRAMRGSMEFLEQTDKPLFDFMKSKGSDFQGRQVGNAVSMSSKGTASNLASGYARGAAGRVTEESRQMATAVGRESFTRGAALADTHLATGYGTSGAGNKGFIEGMQNAHKGNYLDDIVKKAGSGAKVTGKGAARVATNAAGKKIAGAGAVQAAKFAGVKGAGMAAGAFIPGVNIVMAALLAKDLVSMTMDISKKIPGFTRDTLNSFKGGIQKPVFGTMYRDNEVAATSRQRGVSAIQNSQLNARTVLGVEASRLAAHF